MDTTRASGSGSKRRSQGRRKIEKKRKQSNRQVMFSKRRGELFNKASELYIITGAHAVILIWIDKHAFSFGHSTPDAFIGRYLRYDGDGEENLPAAAVVLDMGEYNKYYAEAKEKLDLEKGKAIFGGGAAATGEWWEDNINKKGVQELEMYTAALDELRNKATRNANDLMVINKSNSFTLPLPATLIEAALPMSLDDAAVEFVDGFINDQADGYEYEEFGQGHIVGKWSLFWCE